MKKLILFICILFSCNVYSDTSRNIILGETVCCGDILQVVYNITDIPTNRYVLYCNNDNIAIEMNDFTITQFAKELKKMAKKYAKWADLAKKNGITDLTKKLGTHIFGKTVWFKQSTTWSYENGVDFKTMFKVDDEGNTFAYIESDEMNQEYSKYISTTRINGPFGGASANTYKNIIQHSNGFIILFNSPENIIELSNILLDAKSKKENYLKQQERKSKIFK